MKKGQLMSQPFVYIFALIVGALILVYGISLVWDFINTAKDVETGSFLLDLSEEASRMYSRDVNSNTRFTISLPEGITHVCFVNPENPGKCKEKTSDTETKYDSCNFEDLDDTMEYFLDGGDNVMLIPLGIASVDKDYIEGIFPKDDVTLCVQNGVKVKLTSKGTWVEVS